MTVVTYEHRDRPAPTEPASYDTSLEAISAQLFSLGWVEALVVCGSYAKGSLAPGWSDLDLVAVYNGNLHRARLDAAGLNGPGRANPAVSVGIDFVASETLMRTRKVVGRPLAMSIELRGYAYATFGKNPFIAIKDNPNDVAQIRAESTSLVRADANSWLRRAIAGYPSPRRRLFDAAKTLLRIAMFESSPLSKDGFTVADYCAAVRSVTPHEEIATALTVAEELRQQWEHEIEFCQGEEADQLSLLEQSLIYYCENWEPVWDLEEPLPGARELSVN